MRATKQSLSPPRDYDGTCELPHPTRMGTTARLHISCPSRVCHVRVWSKHMKTLAEMAGDALSARSTRLSKGHKDYSPALAPVVLPPEQHPNPCKLERQSNQQSRLDSPPRPRYPREEIGDDSGELVECEHDGDLHAQWRGFKWGCAYIE